MPLGRIIKSDFLAGRNFRIFTRKLESRCSVFAVKRPQPIISHVCSVIRSENKQRVFVKKFFVIFGNYIIIAPANLVSVLFGVKAVFTGFPRKFIEKTAVGFYVGKKFLEFIGRSKHCSIGILF